MLVPLEFVVFLQELVQGLRNACEVSYKLSVVSCIAEKTACFVLITRSGPCLYFAEFFRICADPFVTDSVAKKVN